MPEGGPSLFVRLSRYDPVTLFVRLSRYDPVTLVYIPMPLAAATLADVWVDCGMDRGRNNAQHSTFNAKVWRRNDKKAQILACGSETAARRWTWWTEWTEWTPWRRTGRINCIFEEGRSIGNDGEVPDNAGHDNLRAG